MPDPPHRGIWVRSRMKFKTLGMFITQNGDQEGAAVFDPADSEQAQAAIGAIRAKKVRKLSPERRAKLVAVGEETRLKPCTRAKCPLTFLIPRRIAAVG